MKHLVVTVSPDSSIDLLRSYADVVLLDAESLPELKTAYDTLYIRSHFSSPATLPQNFRSQIDSIVQTVHSTHPHVRYIDNMSTVDAIVAFEDKWHQYVLFGEFMPRTELYDNSVDLASFSRPVFKKRLSSRGSGVTWDETKTSNTSNEWIVQESLDIVEELRVYVVHGEVYPTGVVHQSKTEDTDVVVLNSRALTSAEMDFSKRVMRGALAIEAAGIDMARTADGRLWLMEVNRSPGFAKFYDHTGVNLADALYRK